MLSAFRLDFPFSPLHNVRCRLKPQSVTMLGTDPGSVEMELKVTRPSHLDLQILEYTNSLSPSFLSRVHPTLLALYQPFHKTSVLDMALHCFAVP